MCASVTRPKVLQHWHKTHSTWPFLLLYICRFYSHTYLAVSAVCLYVCVLGCVCMRGRVAFKPQMRLRVTILWAKPRTWLALMKNASGKSPLTAFPFLSWVFISIFILMPYNLLSTGMNSTFENYVKIC